MCYLLTIYIPICGYTGVRILSKRRKAVFTSPNREMKKTVFTLAKNPIKSGFSEGKFFVLFFDPSVEIRTHDLLNPIQAQYTPGKLISSQILVHIHTRLVTALPMCVGGECRESGLLRSNNRNFLLIVQYRLFVVIA